MLAITTPEAIANAALQAHMFDAMWRRVANLGNVSGSSYITRRADTIADAHSMTDRAPTTALRLFRAVAAADAAIASRICETPTEEVAKWASRPRWGGAVARLAFDQLRDERDYRAFLP